MRKRTKTVLGPEYRPTRNGKLFIQHPENFPNLDSATIVIPTSPIMEYHEMVDSKERRNIFNDVFHTKSLTYVLGPYGSNYDIETTPDRDEYYVHFGNLVGTPEEFRTMVPTMCVISQCLPVFPEWSAPPNSAVAAQMANYPAWALEKWNGPKLSLSTGFSLPNFLIELVDVKRLINHWLNKEVLIDRWHKLMSGNRKLHGSRITAIANERLAHVYGTKTTLSDIKSIHKILTSWKDRADRFLANAGKILKSYKRRKDVTMQSWSTGWRSCPVSFGAESSEARLTIEITPRCCAVLAYFYSVPEHSGFIARLKQLADAFGVKLDAGIAWDAVPFSFVVDWFVNVSEWLHSNWSKDWVHADVYLMEFSHSIKFREIRTLEWRRQDHDGLSAVRILTRDITYYRRVRSDPPVITKEQVDTKDGWKVNRIINAAALATQRARLSGRRFVQVLKADRRDLREIRNWTKKNIWWPVKDKARQVGNAVKRRHRQALRKAMRSGWRFRP